MATVAELSVLVGANISGLQNGMQQASRIVDDTTSTGASRISRITGALDGVQSKVSTMAGQMTQIFAPAGVAMGFMVSTASSFEDSLTELSVRTGTYGDDLDVIRQKALDLGEDTAFSAQQSIDAFLQLVASGSSVEEAMAQIGPVMDVAAASGADLGMTADMITDIMASFRLPAMDGSINNAALVGDALARAAGASSAGIDDLGAGFANVGGQAAAFGLDVEETAAILAIFSENGIKSSEAGTQLRNMLSNMNRDTADVKAAWNSLGTSMYDTAGNMRPMEDILEDIRFGLDGMTDEQRNKTMQDLAGTFGALGLNALLGSTSIEEMIAKMSESASASELAEAKTGTFSGTLDQLRGTIETFMINAGTPFIENVLTPMVGKLTDVVSGIGEWAVANPDIVNGLLLLFGAGIIAIPVLWGISMGLGAIRSAVALLSGPLLPIVMGLGGIALVVQGIQEDDFNKIALGVGAIGVAATIAFGPIGLLAGVIAGLISGLAWLESNTGFLSQGLAAWGDAAAEFETLLVHLGVIPKPVVEVPEGFYLDINGQLQEEIALQPLNPIAMKVQTNPDFMLPNDGGGGPGPSRLTGEPTEVGVPVEFQLYFPDGTPVPDDYDPVLGKWESDPESFLGLGQRFVRPELVTVTVQPSEVVVETPPVITWADSVAMQTSVRASALSFLMGLPIGFDAQMTIAPIVSNVGEVIDSIRSTLTQQPLAATIQAMISVSPVLSGVASTISAVVSAITGANSGGGKPIPEHALGLDRVPYDGYLASLHAEEAVLTASEASAWRALKSGDLSPAASSSSSGGGGGVVQHFHITAYGENPSQLARMIKREMQNQAIGGGAFG